MEQQLSNITNENTVFPEHNETPKNHKLLLKLILIAVLILGLLIPLLFINNLIKERATRQEQVIEEVSQKWAGQQTLAGPYLAVPYKVSVQLEDKTVKTEERQVYIMPQELKINGNLVNEVRKRSLYKVNLYQANCVVEGNFTEIDWKKLNVNKEQLEWHRARMVIGLSDVAGLTNEVQVLWGGNKLTMESYVNDQYLTSTGINTLIESGSDYAQSFKFDLQFKGSSTINFLPLGNTTTVQLQSNFPHPSFNGKFLPSLPQAISSKGFEAQWKTITTQRSFPQAWAGKKVDMHSDEFGVRLVETANAYVQTERVVKYAILFIALTFAVFFLIETLQRLQLHPLQYLLVGLAILIFYILLLSFSEFIGFKYAYLIASIAIVSMISYYIGAVVQSKKMGLGFFIGLSALYAYVYFLIQLEDMALIFGSVAVFFVLGLIMYFTRKVNWYQLQKSK